MKGIILAGGAGTRLYPATKCISKQLLPVYDKPMVYYPLSTLMLANIRDILIISTPRDISFFEELLGDGSLYGIQLSYKVQPSPEGLAQAFIIGKEFIGEDDVCLVLGDNIFHGSSFAQKLDKAISDAKINNKATVFGYWVKDPERYGVAEFNEAGQCISIEEKPKNPKSNYAIVGLYFYPNDVTKKVVKIIPSARGELEITSLNQEYLEENRLNIQLLGRGFAWLDTGTHQSLSEASSYIEAIENRQGLKVACLEGIAYRKGWIDEKTIRDAASDMINNQYGKYLLQVVEDVNNGRDVSLSF